MADLMTLKKFEALKSLMLDVPGLPKRALLRHLAE